MYMHISVNSQPLIPPSMEPVIDFIHAVEDPNTYTYIRIEIDSSHIYTHLCNPTADTPAVNRARHGSPNTQIRWRRTSCDYCAEREGGCT